MHPLRVLMPFLIAVAAHGLESPLAESKELYREPFRPQFHFSPAKNWMNDPNGLVYFDGQYHLFFQYNPYGDTWGHMSWGHATSTDLLHWSELPVAIPEDGDAMIFSGSVVVDESNSSGFGKAGQAPLVSIYTGAGRAVGSTQNQNLAFSLDAGRSWRKYAGNPVLDIHSSAFRDPKVFRYEPGHTWVMAVALSDRHEVAFYSSPDLKSWTHLSDFGPAGASDGAWECPDLFPLPIDGNPDNMRWVLKVDVFRSAIAAGSGTQYFVGRFDGREFKPDADPGQPATVATPHWLDYGMDFYAAMSWGNLPSANRRTVWIAWMNSHHYAQEIPTSPWRGAMSVPRELSLHSSAGSLRLRQAPVRELLSLRGRQWQIQPRTIGALPYRVNLPKGTGKSMEIIVAIAPRSAREVGIDVRVGAGEKTRIGYDRAGELLFIDRSHSGLIPSPEFAHRSSMPLKAHDGVIILHILLDWSSVEVFANDGEGVMTEQLFAAPDSVGIELSANDGTAQLSSMNLWELRSAVPRHAHH